MADLGDTYRKTLIKLGNTNYEARGHFFGGWTGVGYLEGRIYRDGSTSVCSWNQD